MPRIRVETLIRAPVERCFDLARDVEAHTRSTAKTRERAVAGVTSGLLGLGDEVTWEAVHFGVKQRLTAKVTQFDRPHRFADEMVRGAFSRFRHVHEFREERDETAMVDDFEYASPWGFLGRVADALFLERYMRRFLEERAQVLRALAESAPQGP